MLHNKARESLVRGYEASHDAEGIAKAYSVSKWTVQRLAEQKRRTWSAALRTSQRNRKPVLTEKDKENIRNCIAERPDITIEEIREELDLSASYSTVEHLVFVDESGININLPRLYGGASSSQRAVDHTPLNTPQTTTVLILIS